MQLFHLTALSTLVAAATAQSNSAATSLTALPSCAKSCAGTPPASCNLDIKCICTNNDYLGATACCIAKACSPDDFKKAASLSQQLCTTVGVKLPDKAPSTCGTGENYAAAGAAASGASSAASSPAASAQSAASSASSRSMTGDATSMGSAPAATNTSAQSGTTAGNAGAPAHDLSQLGAIGAMGVAVAAYVLF